MHWPDVRLIQDCMTYSYLGYEERLDTMMAFKGSMADLQVNGWEGTSGSPLNVNATNWHLLII